MPNNDLSLTNYGFEVFPPQNSLAYPSTNALNGGQVNSEMNVRYIMMRLTRKSFVMLPEKYDNESKTVDETGNITDSATTTYGMLGAFDITISQENTHSIIIDSGECNINGYYFKCSKPTTLDFNRLNQQNQNAIVDLLKETTDSTLYIKFGTRVDSEGHLLYYNKSANTTSNFKGVVITFTNEKPNKEELWLGSVTFNSNTDLTIKSVTNNSDKFIYINGDNIYIDNSNYPEVNNIYELVDYFIKKLFGGGLNNDLVVIGPEPTNKDNTTNIYITNKNSLHKELLRLYYNTVEHNGGLALYSDTVANNGSLIRNLITFTNLLSNNASVNICTNLNVESITTHTNKVFVKDNDNNTTITVETNGDITSTATITGKVVRGAVWG